MNEDMPKKTLSNIDQVKLLINKLEDHRNIPQFLFNSRITYRETSLVRDEVLKFKKENPNITEIDLIIQSPGGSPDHAYRIIRTFRKAFKKVNIVVPFWAKSAATLLSLGGSKIIMDEFGEFGPLDTQIKVDDAEHPEDDTQSALIDEQSLKRIEQKAMEMYHTMYTSFTESTSKKIRINRTILSEQILQFVSNFYEPLIDKIDPIGIGKKRRYLDIGEQYAIKLLAQYNNQSNRHDVRVFIDYLVNECPDHGFVIDYDVVSLFLDNAIRSEDIGLEYSRLLSKISQIFVNIDVSRFVGFVPKIEVQKKSIKSTKVKKVNKNESKRQKKT